MPSPFDFINAISYTKKDLLDDPQSVKEYNKTKFIVNRGLAYFPDTLMYANEMNRYHFLPPKQQFLFLLNSISKRKRFSKWVDKEVKHDSLSLVMEYYGYSSEKAKQALHVLTVEQLDIIKQKQEKGGK